MKHVSLQTRLLPIVVALLLLAAALPAAASIPQDLPAWWDLPVAETSAPSVDSPPEPASPRLRLYELALLTEDGWRLPPRRAFASTYAQTRVWGLEFLCSGQVTGSREFSGEIAEGVCDGPSQYAFAGNDPVNYGDPLGLYLGATNQELAAAHEAMTPEHKAQFAAAQGVVTHTAAGAGRDVGGMVAGLADLGMMGTPSAIKEQISTFRATEGSFFERLEASSRAGMRQKNSVMTFGFSSAPDKLQHLEDLSGVQAVQDAGTLLGTAYATDNGEMALEGVGRLLEGAGQISGLAAGGAGSIQRFGHVPRASFVHSKEVLTQTYRNLKAARLKKGRQMVTRWRGTDYVSDIRALRQGVLQSPAQRLGLSTQPSRFPGSRFLQMYRHSRHSLKPPSPFVSLTRSQLVSRGFGRNVFEFRVRKMDIRYAWWNLLNEAEDLAVGGTRVFQVKRVQ